MNNMEHIKPGDQVVVIGRFSDGLTTVERVTKTQIVTDGVRWRRRDGFTVGRGPFDVGYIRDATDDDRARITYREAVKRAETALDTHRLIGPERNQSQTYKTRLLEAKAIIDAALDAGEATA